VRRWFPERCIFDPGSEELVSQPDYGGDPFSLSPVSVPAAIPVKAGWPGFQRRGNVAQP